MSAQVVVRVRGLGTEVRGAHILRDINLSVTRGEILALVGPSGGGKTTLLRGLNYLTPFTAGDVEIAGIGLRPGLDERADAALLRAARTRAGMVFQNFHLFPHLSAIENVMAAPRLVLGLPVERARERGRDLLARVGLAGHADAWPHTLSGGQQQRVAIARAMAMEPQVLLLDEPTSALDPRLVGEVLAAIADLARTGQTMIIVTHEVAFARKLAHRVAVLAAGRIVEEGSTAEVLEHPRSAATRHFLGFD